MAKDIDLSAKIISEHKILVNGATYTIKDLKFRPLKVTAEENTFETQADKTSSSPYDSASEDIEEPLNTDSHFASQEVLQRKDWEKEEKRTRKKGPEKLKREVVIAESDNKKAKILTRPALGRK